MGMYLTYVGRNPSVKLLLFGLFFSLYFPMRATNTLMRSVRIAYHLGPPRGALSQLVKTLLYTAVLIATIALTLTLMSVGDRLLLYAVGQLRPAPVLGGAVGGPAVPGGGGGGVFCPVLPVRPVPGRTPALRNIWPGTMAALGAWLLLNWLYASYVQNFADYSLLYGSIGTAIALLIWLYMTAVTLIMGAELNATLISLRKDRAGES